MTIKMITKTHLLTLAAVGLMGVAASSHAQPTPAEGLALPAAPAEPAPETAAPSVVEYAAPAAPAIECCPIRVLREVATPSAKKKYRCYGSPIKQVLCVDNPADCGCKHFAVPVCVPSCCTGEPVCCGSHTGLLGRGYVTYRWPCGFEVNIAFRVHGGVLLTYS